MRDLDAILEGLGHHLEAIERERHRCRRLSAIYLVVLLVPLAAGIVGAVVAPE